jgi:hypothetical protein
VLKYRPMILSQHIRSVRMWLRLEASPQSLVVILRAGGLLLVLLGTLAISWTVHYTREQFLTMMEPKPLSAPSLHAWFPAPASFRVGGTIVAALGIAMILLSAICRRNR